MDNINNENNEFIENSDELNFDTQEKKHGIWALLSYVGVNYILIYLISFAVAIILNILYPNLLEEYATLSESYSAAVSGGDKEIISAAYQALMSCQYYIKAIAWANIIASTTNFIITVCIFRKCLLRDFKRIFKEYQRVILVSFCGFVIMFFLSMIINLIIAIVTKTDSSINQETIIAICSNGYLVPMFFLTVIFAPIAEELVFRKSIFCIFKNPVIAILVSTFLFGAIHVVSGGDWFYIFSYAISGLCLSLIYYFSKRNIWAPIVAHVINNGISYFIIMMTILGFIS